MSGGWTPNVICTRSRAARIAFDETAQGFPAGEPGQDRPLGRRLPRRLRARRRRSLTAPPPAPRRSAKRRRSRRGSRARRPPRAARSALAPSGRPSAPARPSSTSRTTSPRAISRSATREGMRSIEHIKRYTTTGMGADQGKTSNLNALAIVAAALGKPIAEVGTDDLPPALYAGDVRRLRRPFARRSVRPDPRDAAARAGRRGRARCSRTPASGNARRAFRCRARRRRDAASASAWRRAPRRRSWMLRRSARSRSSAPTRPSSSSGSTSMRSPSSAVGRCRYALMLSEDGYVDRRRRRHAARRGSLPRHHDDRRRRRASSR